MYSGRSGPPIRDAPPNQDLGRAPKLGLYNWVGIRVAAAKSTAAAYSTAKTRRRRHTQAPINGFAPSAMQKCKPTIRLITEFGFHILAPVEVHSEWFDFAGPLTPVARFR